MVVGATGCGKSSTINALFGREVSKVGDWVDPESMEITRHELDNLIIWDTPGLGDGKEADNRHSKKIIDKLYEKDSNGDLLIDLVLVILDAGTRNMGTDFELINNVIIPNLGDDKNRILVALNQADIAMKGQNWNSEEVRPEQKLVEFLDAKVQSVKRRIKESTGVDVEPIYYSAGYKEAGKSQTKPYNLSKLLYYILEHTPSKKRIVYADNMNRSSEMWQHNDTLSDYNEKVKKSFVESVMGGISEGANIGGQIGGIFGTVGKAVGSVVGGVIGGVCSFIGGIFGW